MDIPILLDFSFTAWELLSCGRSSVWLHAAGTEGAGASIWEAQHSLLCCQGRRHQDHPEVYQGSQGCMPRHRFCSNSWRQNLERHSILSLAQPIKVAVLHEQKAKSATMCFWQGCLCRMSSWLKSLYTSWSHSIVSCTEPRDSTPLSLMCRTLYRQALLVLCFISVSAAWNSLLWLNYQINFLEVFPMAGLLQYIAEAGAIHLSCVCTQTWCRSTAPCKTSETSF